MALPPESPDAEEDTDREKRRFKTEMKFGRMGWWVLEEVMFISVLEEWGACWLEDVLRREQRG